MPDVSTLVVFSGIALLFAASPGPNFVFVLTRALAGGRQDGFAAVLGIVTGGLVHTLAAVLGLSALLATSVFAFAVVKYAGAAYLVYLGVKTLLGSGGLVAESRGVLLGGAYRQGFMTMLLNPKAALYYFSFLPQFVNPDVAAWGQLLVFGFIQTSAAFLVYSFLSFMAASVRLLLRGNKRFQVSQKFVTGFTYIALGGAVALGGRE